MNDKPGPVSLSDDDLSQVLGGSAAGHDGQSALTGPDIMAAPPPAAETLPEARQAAIQASADRLAGLTDRPNPANPELNHPDRFTDALNAALRTIESARHDDHVPGREAVRLLNEESGLRDLVAKYRAALHQL